MNIRRVVTFFVLFLLTITLTTTRRSSAFSSADRPSAFGEGQFTFLDLSSFPFHTETVAFSFSATVNKNGKGKGRAQFDYLRTQTQVVVKLECVSIFTSDAVMSGKVLHSDNPNFPKGVDVIFAATDGSQVPVPFFRDRITPIFQLPDGFDCAKSGGPLTILPLDAGDIVVQP